MAVERYGRTPESDGDLSSLNMKQLRHVQALEETEKALLAEVARLREALLDAKQVIDRDYPNCEGGIRDRLAAALRPK